MVYTSTLIVLNNKNCHCHSLKATFEISILNGEIGQKDGGPVIVKLEQVNPVTFLLSIAKYPIFETGLKIGKSGKICEKNF